jgi:beta-glucanase (GH16 family)
MGIVFRRWLYAALFPGFCMNASAASAEMLQFLDASAVVWAVNFGGEAHQGADGIPFSADTHVGGAVGEIDAVLGAQDEMIYRTYRMGELSLSYSLPDGVYDLTLYFAEPNGAAPGQRVFDVLVQGDPVISLFDVSLSRSSSAPSALVRTVTGVHVKDGELGITLRSVKSDPIISGLSIRERRPDPRAWRMLWSDEFDYQGKPDEKKWQVDKWPAGKVNDEDQAYTSRPENIRVADGKLILEAKKEDYQGASYTSGRLHSRGQGDFLYGRIDIKAKLPRGQGLWSALWMLPSDPYVYATNCGSEDEWQGNPDCDAWPNSGEIDIMEHVGYDMRRVHSTVHNHRFFSSGPELRNASIEVEDVAAVFHVYSLEWTPELIRVFVDGVEFYSYKKLGDDWRDWPFDQPFHLIMNLAVGGLWGRAGGPIDPEVFPAVMEIDYVRVFEPLPTDSPRPGG